MPIAGASASADSTVAGAGAGTGVSAATRAWMLGSSAQRAPDTLGKIKAENWTLNITRYVLPPLQGDISPLPEAIAAFKDALTHCREAEERLALAMAEGGWL